MKSKRKKKKSGKIISIVLTLIIVAVAGVLYSSAQKDKYVTATQSSEKKAEVDLAVEQAVYTKTDGTPEACRTAFKALGIGIVMNDELTISCDPSNAIEKADIWNKDGKSFTLALSGASVNKSSYSCLKNAGTTEYNPMVITANMNKSVVITNANAFTYDGKTCPAKSVKLTYDLRTVEPDYNNISDGSTSQEDPDNPGQTISFDESVSDDVLDVEADFEMTKEEDDEEQIDDTPSTVTGTKGHYEIVKNLGKYTSGEKKGKSYTFNTYKNLFNKKHTTEAERKKFTYIFTGKTREEATNKSKDKSGKSKTISLTCNYKLTAEQVKKIEDYNKQALFDADGEITPYYYDEKNTQYYKGYWEYSTKVSLKYKYHYLPKNNKNSKQSTVKTEKAEFTCKKTCTEIVQVKYGPPIQVKSGLCFEYRLKVSSVVNCTATPGKDIKKPRKPSQTKICKLAPMCGSHRQAGPSEDFEACVKSCDGGKYTEECSNACYDAVYGEDGEGTTEEVDYTNSLPLIAEQLTHTSKAPAVYKFYYNNPDGTEKSYGDIGCVRGQHYYDYKNKRYDWCPVLKSGKTFISNNGGKTNKNSTTYAAMDGDLGIWYYFQKYKTKWFNGHSYSTDANGRGFIRAQYANGQCPERCTWYRMDSSHCSTNSYYYFNYRVSNYYKNRSKGKTDTKKRCPRMYVWSASKKKYEEKQICTTAELIKADYKNNMKTYKEKVKDVCIGKASCTESTAQYTINFKYKQTDEQVQEVKFPLTKSKDELISSKSSHVLNTNPEVIIRYGGCYANNNLKKWYLTEWTFPGTWVPYKGNERKWKKPSPEGQYTLIKGKVCIPRTLVDTNKQWANYYLQVVDSNYKNAVASSWKFSGKAYNATRSKSDKTYNGYNIYGQAKKFGLFKWNFNISCFYALTKTYKPCEIEPCDPTPECETPPCDSGGDCETPPCEKSISGTSNIRSVDPEDPFLQKATSRVQYKQVRKIGFNWTKEATLVKYAKAGGGYNQNPEQYYEYIKKHPNVFSQTPDAVFTLNQKTIRQLRSNYTKNYTDLIGKPTYSTDGHGLSHYHSSLLRSINPSFNRNDCNNRTCSVKGGK